MIRKPILHPTGYLRSSSRGRIRWHVDARKAYDLSKVFSYSGTVHGFLLLLWNRSVKAGLFQRIIFIFALKSYAEVKISIMIKTITIDIINDKAIKLLQDLELLQMIRLHKEKQRSGLETNWKAKYKGAMQKQSLIEVENQLNELRNAWE